MRRWTNEFDKVVTNKNKVTILIHGFKRQDHDDFGDFYKYAVNKVDHELVLITYYENNKRSTLHWRKWRTILDNEIKKHKGKHINLVGYSMGALAAIRLAAVHEDVKSVYAFYPPFRIIFWDWIGRLWNNSKDLRAAKRKMGRKKWKRVKKLRKKGVSEKYPALITTNMHQFQLHNRKFIKWIEGIRLHVVLSDTDEIVHTPKSWNYFYNRIDLEANDVTTERTSRSHLTTLDKENTHIFDDVIKFISEN